MLLTEDIIFFFTVWEWFITTFFPWSEFIIFFDAFCARLMGQPARMSVMLEEKYTLLLYWKYKLFIKRTHDQEKNKAGGEMIFLLKQAAEIPFRLISLNWGLSTPHATLNMIKENILPVSAFTVRENASLWAEIKAPRTYWALLLLSTLYRQSPLVQGINSCATLNYYIPSPVIDFKKNL